LDYPIGASFGWCTFFLEIGWHSVKLYSKGRYENVRE